MRQRLTWLGVVVVSTIGWGQQSDAMNDRSGAQGRQAGMAAFQAAMKSTEPARDAALRNLVRTAHEEVAGDAIVALIRFHALDVEALALNLLPKLSDLHQRNVLAAAEHTRDNQFRTILARAVLFQIVNDPASAARRPGEEGGHGTAGLAAMLLADSTKAADRDLIGRVARTRPHDSGLWLALAKLGIVNAQDISLARSVMQDTQSPRWARLAAATALANEDSAARDFVTAALRSFLDKFGRIDTEVILAQAMRQTPGGNPAEFADFQPGIRMIGILEFLQTPDAERITFEFLNATNQWVREGLGLVAVMRWPERFLALPPLHFEEHIKLRAALSVYHVELLPRVQAVVPPEDLARIRADLMNGGIQAIFSLPGNAGLVF